MNQSANVFIANRVHAILHILSPTMLFK